MRFRPFAFIFVTLIASARGASLELEMEHTHGSGPLLLDSLRYPLPSGETVSVSRLSYLLGGFALARKEGGWAELPGQFAWIDAETRRLSFALQGIPPGEYRELRFAVGLDPETNAADPARHPAGHPLNPNVNGLHWSWQGGFIFLAIEGHHRQGGGEPAGFSYHFARDPNRTVITLPLGLKLDAQTVGAARIGFDVGALLGGKRAVSPARDGASTHSREGDPIAAALRANLAGAFSVRAVPRGALALPVPPVAPLFLPEKFTPHRFTFSDRMPVPALPRDNPLTVERVELGRRLFHEPLLSRDGTISCASCHHPDKAFADPRRFSVGIEGRTTPRHGMALLNLAWKSSFFWDGRAPSLRAQALLPIQDHAEMDEQLGRVVEKLRAHPDYPDLFARAFSPPGITPEKLGLAIENFLLTLVSNGGKFDRYMRQEIQLTPEEKRGFELFFLEYEPRTGQGGADCFHCHGGAFFTDHQFHNNGLGDENDLGRFAVTGREGDRGKFVTPSLRNVALTAPYMHDGRFATLEEVVQHYNRGVRRGPTLDPNLAKHPAAGLGLSDADVKALVAFLHTLTDDLPGKPAAR